MSQRKILFWQPPQLDLQGTKEIIEMPEKESRAKERKGEERGQ